MAAEPLDLLADLIARARAAGADAADAVLIAGTSLSVCSAGWARPSMSSAPKAATSACACSWASRRRSCRPPRSTRPASRTWPSAPSRWRGWCRRTRSPAWPTPPRRRRPVALDLDDPSRARHRGADRPRRRGRGRRAGGARRHQLGRRRGRVRPHRGGAWSPPPGSPAGRARTSHSVSATALAGTGTGMQRDYDYHSHGAPGRSGRPGGDRPQRRRARGGPAQSRSGRRPRSCRWSTIRASPAACSATWSGAINGAVGRARHHAS